MIYTINNCIRAFGYTNFDNLIADMGSVDNLREYVRANGYADIAVAEDTELLLVDVNGKTFHTGCYGAKLGPEPDYLCFTSTGDSTISMRQERTPTDISKDKVLQYKLNDGQWQTWDLSAVTLHDGDKMYLKSDDEIPISESMYINKHFTITGSIAASGNIMSLLNFSDTLTDYAFYYLFNDCVSLTSAPELPATTLTEHCYSAMFQRCTALTQAPALPATTLASRCYEYMFKGCTSLVQSPELPATTISWACYSSMFSGCTSLTTASALPATKLIYGCYERMFENCTSLTTAPELPAKELVEWCYNNMFEGCTNLNYVKALFTQLYNDKAPYNWLNNVSPTGTFDKSKDATWTNEQAGIPTGWTILVEGVVPPEPEPERDYLCFTSTGDSTVSMTQKGTPETSANKVIQYKLNNGQWQTWDLSAVSLSDGDKMYLKSDDEIPISESYSIYKQFVMTGSIAASGNIMSLLNFSDTLTDYGLTFLFADCVTLTAAPELPATTLPAYCYAYMFNGCTSLTTAPELPATTLANYCYSYMFRICTSLTTAPELPATTLAPSCYYGMFMNCANLNYVKAMFTDISAENCLEDWLYGVSPTGTFIKSKDATWTNEQAGIPTGWTVQVEGGVTPEPEPERDYLCFTSTGDSTVKMQSNSDPTDISKDKVIQYKVNDGQWQTLEVSYAAPVVSLSDGDKMYLKSDDTIPMSEEGSTYRSFIMTGSIAASGNVMSLYNFSTTLPNHGLSYLFAYCKSLTAAPELPATTLGEYCYASMFSSCTSLTQAPALPATTLAAHCYDSMFQNCSSITQAPELPATTLVTYCYGWMFYDCSKLNYVKAMFTDDISTNYPLMSWLNNVSETGTFVKNSAATWDNTSAGIPSGWTVQTASPDK